MPVPCWQAWSRSTEMHDEVTAGALLASLKQEYGNA